MRALIWLLPTAVCAAAVVWFGAQTINRDQTDPDSYEIYEHWLVLVLGLICMAGGGVLGAAAAFSDLLEGEAAVIIVLVGAAYAFLLAGGTYCMGSYFARRVIVSRQSVTYRNMAGVRGSWYIDQISCVEIQHESTICVLGENGKLLFKVETNMKNAGRFVRDMKKRQKERAARSVKKENKT